MVDVVEEEPSLFVELVVQVNEESFCKIESTLLNCSAHVSNSYSILSFTRTLVPFRKRASAMNRT